MSQKKMRSTTKKMKLSVKEQRKLIASLLEIIRARKRVFPWRKHQTSYRVLVSELMLQQTQVVRVIPKFELFMKCYPTLQSLKDANLRDLLILWKGLGYMRRIKNLYILSQQVSKLPKKYEELIALPGIGPYTAGAVMAFAYNTFVPITETNIKTVLCHHFCDKKEGVCTALFYKEILPTLHAQSGLSARHFYEAMMDYGTELKKVKVPTCASPHKQSPYKGSLRELRAKTLFAITEGKKVPEDERLPAVLKELLSEGFIIAGARGYEIARLS